MCNCNRENSFGGCLLTFGSPFPMVIDTAINNTRNMRVELILLCMKIDFQNCIRNHNCERSFGDRLMMFRSPFPMICIVDTVMNNTEEIRVKLAPLFKWKSYTSYIMREERNRSRGRFIHADQRPHISSNFRAAWCNFNSSDFLLGEQLCRGFIWNLQVDIGRSSSVLHGDGLSPSSWYTRRPIRWRWIVRAYRQLESTS